MLRVYSAQAGRSRVARSSIKEVSAPKQEEQSAPCALEEEVLVTGRAVSKGGSSRRHNVKVLSLVEDGQVRLP